MSESITLIEPAPAAQTAGAARVEIFDPPLCCPTGVCGPTVDQTLLDVNEMILALKAEGVGVERYQMAGNPAAFLGNADVMRLVRERQMDALPITVVQGHVVKAGAYPTLAEVKIRIFRCFHRRCLTERPLRGLCIPVREPEIARGVAAHSKILEGE
jgi:hypothetical protein